MVYKTIAATTELKRLWSGSEESNLGAGSVAQAAPCVNTPPNP